MSNGGWWEDPQPTVNPHHCARCKSPDGELLEYPAGIYHAACALLEQEDDRAYRAQREKNGGRKA